MLNSVSMSIKELVAALLILIVYMIIYILIENSGGDTQGFLMLMGLFWLALIGLRAGR